MTDLQSLTLSRLRRCVRWTEISRTTRLVRLIGVTASGDVKRMDFDAAALDALVAAGRVTVDASHRLLEGDGSGPGREVTVRYWAAVEPLS